MATISKTKRVENYCRSQIASGSWVPGQRVPAPDDLGNSLDVGYVTVRNVMTRLAEEGLLERRQRLGTFVATRPQTASIAIIAQAAFLRTPGSGFHTRCFERALEVISASGYEPFLAVGHGTFPDDFMRSLRIFRPDENRDIVGVVSLGEMGPIEDELNRAGMPAVSVSAGSSTDNCAVILDYRALFRMGRQLLEEQGYQDFALMYSEPPEKEKTRILYHDLDEIRQQALNGAVGRLIACPFSYDLRQAYQVMKDYWRAGHRPGAIFFSDDVLFDVASRALLELGVKVPEELAIIMQGSEGTHYHFPQPVTALVFDPEKAVDVALGMLEDLISGRELNSKSVLLPPRLRPGATL